MPIILVHGVTVREAAYVDLSDKVRKAAGKHSETKDRYFASFFWGGDAERLICGGATIPEFPRSDQIDQLIEARNRVPVPDYKALLLSYPLAELESYSATWAPGSEEPRMNPADPVRERNRLLRGYADAIATNLSFPGLEDVESICAHVFDAAIATKSQITLVQLKPMVVNAITASICRALLDPTSRTLAGELWPKVYADVEPVVDKAFGFQMAPPKFLVNAGLSLATFALRHGLRAEIMPPVVRFLGDTMIYLADREHYLEGLHTFIIEAKRKEREEMKAESPLWLISHSMGGIVAYDYACRYPEDKPERLATVGSQVGLFAEADLLLDRWPQGVECGKRQPAVPAGNWVSVYDLNDMLSFKVDPVFGPGIDKDVSLGFAFPASHGAYWDSGEVYDLIFKAVPKK